ncbi:hypothetical protein SERLADRAFT_415890 [Serpula lacrymans var. lacrymans S7.9]|uniref:C2 domain-containing protein n=1 Tax=Serpula lacrymans var. lacrymans (strain S7.9) TaxID=578457 RepID=F8NWM2_SERL9|nr:uncharacterized protein SERLADRAFT_415890 [Serpula lacrymans var. lacrymans S7.9]EGO25046.1 hypothetical protein SERLADRAFT_415890 [Serpula lacrymans var. lacrymans S7.9]
MQFLLTVVGARGLKHPLPTPQSCMLFVTIKADGCEPMKTDCVVGPSDPNWNSSFTLNTVKTSQMCFCIRHTPDANSPSGDSMSLGEANMEIGELLLSLDSSNGVSIPIYDSKSEQQVCKGYLDVKIGNLEDRHSALVTSEKSISGNVSPVANEAVEIEHPLPLSNQDKADLVVETARAKLQSCPPQSSSYKELLSIFSNSLLSRYEQKGHGSHIAVLCNLANALKHNFTRYGQSSDLEQSIQLYRSAVDSCSPRDPKYLAVVQSYASGLRLRFSHQGDAQDLELAIQSCIIALDHCQQGHPHRAALLQTLSNSIFSRFDLRGQPNDLKLVIEYSTTALELRPPGHPARFSSLYGLAEALQFRFDREGDYKDLELSTEYQRSAMALCRPGHHSYPLLLNSLGNALLAAFQHRGDYGKLQSAIEILTDGVKYSPEGDVNRTLLFTNLANALWNRFHYGGDSNDLVLAIDYYEKPLNLQHRRNPNYISSLFNLANALLLRFRQKGQLKDLDLAFDYFRTLFEICPSDHATRPTCLTGFGSVLINRFKEKGDIRDLKQAIQYFEEGLAICQPGDPMLNGPMLHLADALIIRFRQEGCGDDLELAIKYCGDIIGLLQPEHITYKTCLMTFGDALYNRFEQQAEITDLDLAISYYRRTLLAVDHVSPIYSLATVSLANALLEYFKQRAKIDDLEEAIQLYATSLRECPSGHPNRSTCLTNFGNALICRFQCRGDVDDMELAIQYHTEVVELHSPEHYDHSLWLSNLACGIFARYQYQADSDDLSRVIAYYNNALEHSQSLKGPKHFALLTNLGTCLSLRFRVDGVLSDLTMAIQYHRTVLESLPPKHPMVGLALTGLGSALYSRYESQGDLDDLEQAIQFAYSSLKLMLPDDPSYAMTVCQLSDFLLICYTKDKSLQTLLAVYLLLQKAVAYTPDDHPNRVRIYQSLIKIHGVRFNLNHEAGDQEKIFEYYNSALSHSTGSPFDRLQVALGWVTDAEKFGDTSALKAYQVSFDLLDHHITATPSVSSRHQVLQSRKISEIMALSADATSCAIREGKLELAVELSERSRGMLWTQLSRFRTPLDDLRLVGKAGKCLADRFETLNGPVVIVNISQHSCDAIIILQTGPPRHVRLPDVTATKVSEISTSLLDILKSTSGIGEEKTRERGITMILRELWELIVKPVVGELMGIIPRGSRIWWCPTSKLSSLPLHAAGQYHQDGRNLSNIYISSYTPTIAALIRSRRYSTDTRTFLAIGQAQPSQSSQEPELKSVGTELKLVKGLVPASVSFTELNGDEGTSDAALQGFREHSWIHLACHGKQDFAQPFDSSFALRDKPLRLIDIIGEDLSHQQFAFLSACHTAVGDRKTPDEVIHLAAGMQFSGFRSVIGTMWAVDDKTAQHMVSEFYTHMFSEGLDCTNAAKALNKAAKTAKTKFKEVSLDQRIVFIHIGA